MSRASKAKSKQRGEMSDILKALEGMAGILQQQQELLQQQLQQGVSPQQRQWKGKRGRSLNGDGDGQEQSAMESDANRGLYQFWEVKSPFIQWWTKSDDSWEMDHESRKDFLGFGMLWKKKKKKE
jgi:hypothetical protein